MKLEVYKQDGVSTGRTLQLSDNVFGIEPNTHVIYQAVRAHMANRRQGTSAAKNRSAVRGGGRKPWRQKGRGTARSGTIRSPIWVGGGVTFGPSPREYKLKLPKKMNKLARISALSIKAQESGIKLIENFSIESGKTKEMFNVLKGVELESTKVLMLVSEGDAKTVQASRNIPNFKVRIADTVSTYDILNCHTLLIQESALDKLENSLAS